VHALVLINIDSNMHGDEIKMGQYLKENFPFPYVGWLVDQTAYLNY